MRRGFIMSFIQKAIPQRPEWMGPALGSARLAWLCGPKSLIQTGKSLPTVLGREKLTAVPLVLFGEMIANYLQEAGPLFTKLGQVLVTRGEILPKESLKPLEQLLDSQAPISFQIVESVLQENQIFDQFADFEEKPLAVGSVGQVHKASLKDGTEVIVKIAKPDLESAIQRDMEVLQGLLKLYSNVTGNHSEYWSMLLKDLERSFLQELNFENEAESLQKFREQVVQHNKVYIPQFFEELSSENVLVMEYLEGKPLAKVRNDPEADQQLRKQLAGTVLDEVLQQIFSSGYFHGDPHAGNFILMEDGRIGMIDLGLTGTLTGPDRKRLGEAVRAVIRGDREAAYKALLGFGYTPDDFDSEAFKEGVKQTFADYKENPDRPGLEILVNELFQVAHQHRLYVPPDTVLLIKSLVTIEGLAKSLDPDINVIARSIPVVLKARLPKALQNLIGRFG